MTADADAGSTLAQPLLLLANRDEVYRRSLASVLTQGGNRVVAVETDTETLRQARRRRPDGIIVDVRLAPPDGASLCRELRADPAVSLATPIVLTTAGRASRAQQLDALRAGAWELRGEPLDTEELLLRLAAYVQGKLEVERLGAAGLVDATSGLYNAVGITRRSEELAAFSTRQGLPLACVVFRSADGSNGADADRVAVAFKRVGRISDAIGRTSPAEVAIFAPATDGPAAGRLVARLTATVARALNTPARTLRAGYSSAPAMPQIDPVDLLNRARMALDAPPPAPPPRHPRAG